MKTQTKVSLLALGLGIIAWLASGCVHATFKTGSAAIGGTNCVPTNCPATSDSITAFLTSFSGVKRTNAADGSSSYTADNVTGDVQLAKEIFSGLQALGVTAATTGVAARAPAKYGAEMPVPVPTPSPVTTDPAAPVQAEAQALAALVTAYQDAQRQVLALQTQLALQQTNSLATLRAISAKNATVGLDLGAIRDKYAATPGQMPELDKAMTDWASLNFFLQQLTGPQ